MRLAVFISGRGSNLAKLIDHKNSFQIKLVISSSAKAKGLEHAKKNNITCKIYPPSNFSSKPELEKRILEDLIEHKIDYIALAGYLPIIGKLLLEKYPNKIFNIHPSLLPLDRGLNAAQKALDRNAKFTGATVHLIDTEIDKGTIIAQHIVPILAKDNSKILAERILFYEHKIYAKAISSYINKWEL